VYVRADISGKGHFEVKVGGTPVGLNTVWTPANAQFTFGGTSKPTSGVPTFFISTLPLDLTLARPFHIGLSPNPPVNAIATMGYTDVGPAFTSYSAGFGLPGAALDLVITGWDGTYIEGTFTGTMIDLATGKPPLVVTNGQFRVKLQTGH
jgi:hypothetical protein